jgi:carboxyl-terminal processing protease
MQPKRKLQTGKVFVLMNESGASVAGNPCRNSGIMIGTIVGRRSFGKGLVQREMNFEDGSAVRLTLLQVFYPTGESIQTIH